MTTVTQEMKDEVKEIVYDFFAEECEVDKESLNDDTNVIEDLEAGLAEMEARLEALGAGLGSFDSERIGDQVRRSVSRARRNADRARARSARAVRKAQRAAEKASKRSKTRRVRVDLDLDTLGKKRKPVSDEERLSILRMLEKGTITVDEAEKLLQALEANQ